NTTLVPMTVRAWTWEGSGPEVGGGHTKVCAAYNTNQCTVQVYQSGRVVLEALVNGKVKTQSVEIAVVGGDTLPLPPVDTIPTDTIPTDTIPGGGGGGGGCGGAGSSSDCGGGPDSSVVHVIASRPEMLPLVTGMSFDANLQQNYTGGFSGLPRHFEEAGRPDTTWLEITVRQRKDGTSPAGAQIQLTMTPLEESGGHIHTQGLARPTGSFYRSSAASQRTGPGSDRGTITLTTDSSGKVKVLYRTSGLAGVEIIEVKTVDAQHPAKPDTVRLTLRVPGLVEMDSMHQDRYVFKPQDPSKPAQQHGNNNRWVLPAFRDSVLEVFDGFWLNSGMVVDDSSYDHLYITDAGLPWGGLFDYHGDSEWSSPHQTHRIGNDLDLRSSSLSAGARAILQRECRARGAKLPTGTTNRVDRCTPEGDHIHIEGLNR
ncbi:MAG TPA: hypothetical protein VG940_11410, partial [Gemmatimonadales bacterium]|nr:hypothetical protein [Gemmatimonadales bacterium]